MRKMVNGYSWTDKKRTTEFILHDLEKWEKQNGAELLECAEGCLLDNYVFACKRGTAWIFEEYANEWSSRYHAFYIPYKEQASNPDYNKLWNRFERLQAVEEC